MAEHLDPQEVALLIKARQILKAKGLDTDSDITGICEAGGISRKTGYQWARDLKINDEDRDLKDELARIKAEGARRKQIGLIIDGAPLKGPNTRFWTVNKDGAAIGKVTSAVYSPRLDRNIALAMVDVEHAHLGAEVEVVTGSGPTGATIVERPFYDPKKSIAAA